MSTSRRQLNQKAELELVWALHSIPSPVPPAEDRMVRIAIAQSPYQTVAATPNVVVDVQTGNSSNASIIVHPPTNPADGDPFKIKVNLGDASAAPILVEPIAGQAAIEDPSQPGAFRTNVATFASVKSGPGSMGSWTYNASLHQWLLYGVI